MNWISNANCRSVPTSSFFDDFENADATERIKILSVCADCSVRKECQEYAESKPDTCGVWGGYFYKHGKRRDALRVSRPKFSMKTAEEFVL